MAQFVSAVDYIAGGGGPRRSYLRTNAVASLSRAGVNGLAVGLARSFEQIGQSTSRQLNTLAEVFAQKLVPNARMRAVHHDVGAAAQRSVLRSYDQTVTARKTVPSYRESANDPRNRRFPHQLRAALASPDFFEATNTGLRWVNQAMLDRTAIHWRRLNFGAAPRGQGSRATFIVSWADQLVASLGYNMPARPSFLLPRGYWVENGHTVPPGAPGTSQFFPIGELPAGVDRYRGGLPTSMRGSQGIEARNFLDAGLQTIAERFPRAYQDLYRELFEEAKQGVGPLSSVVSPPRPAHQNIRVYVERDY